MILMKTTADKKMVSVLRATNKKMIKALEAQASEIRAQWALRGVAEGEFEKVKALEDMVWELSEKKASSVDSMFR